MSLAPRRVEIWLVNLNPILGHVQAGLRPALVFSMDGFNTGKAELVVVIPMTSTVRSIPTQVLVQPPDGGVKVASAELCEALRSVSKSRLTKRLGQVIHNVMADVENCVRIPLGL